MASPVTPLPTATAVNITDPYDNRGLVITNSILASVICIVTIVGVLGNSFVILLFALSRQLQTVTNIFVVSLTLSDLIGCATLSLDAVALFSLRGWPLQDWVCKMVGAVTLIAFKASIVHLALISINRLFVITRPKIQYLRLYRHRNVVLMIGVAWLAPLTAIVLPPTLGFGRLGYNSDNHFCVFDGTRLQLRIMYVIEEVLFVITFCIISFCYLKIYIYVTRQYRNMMQFFLRRSNKAPASNKKKMLSNIDKREIEITKNLFVVVCAYFICILPHTICLFTEKCYLYYFKHTAVIYAINSCINPYIYCFKQPIFKQVSLCVVRCRWSEIPKPSAWLQRLLRRTRERGLSCTPTPDIIATQVEQDISIVATVQHTSVQTGV
ncbi:melatonin receptor type 1B-B-like [Strongylocentrotus purpuratus]|uniref:G-protein coupled receptors family 1 profile domain-containing protein n=1 Tax=Strongylocentrotus purpuratus TaxID=7668 RepID=A0A7M7RGQ0_STRPU|nr:melatonin receptor type 1B-B-like [Strongylocentrotus purpuratus]|eukprot:XP_793828.1 PREDICTED: melatonin receptor type 1B-B-like [Strongylocentrotus purpuratus]